MFRQSAIVVEAAAMIASVAHGQSATKDIVDTAVAAGSFKTLAKALQAVSGDTIDIKASGGSVMVEEARVIKTDITASNGVIHVIDSVILPDAAK